MVAMKYQIIKPNAFLRKYVEHFWEAETDEYFRYISPASTLTDFATTTNSISSKNLKLFVG